MTDCAEIFDQLQVKLYLELNVIETNNVFVQKRGVNKIELGIKMDPMGYENVKEGGQSQGSFPLPLSMGVPSSHYQHSINWLYLIPREV